MKKYVCIVLLVLSVFLFCACQKEEVLLAETITGSYRETIIPIPENYCVYEAPIYSDGVFAADLFYTDNGGESFDLVLNKKTISFDKFGGNITVIPYQGSEIDIYRWEKGDALFVSDEYFSVTYTSDGNQICTLDLPKIFDYNIEKEIANLQFTPLTFSIIDIIGSKNGTYYILTTKGICAITSDGDVKWTQTERKNPMALVMTDAGLLYLAGGDDENILRFINENDGSLGEIIDMPDCIKGGIGIGSANSSVSFYRGDSVYDFYAATSQALWGVTVKLEKNGSVSCNATECVNWLNSDITPSTIVNLCIADENTVAVIRKQFMFDAAPQLILLTKRQPDELAEMKIITLALLAESRMINIQMLQNAIETFNRSSSGYRIVVTDFTVYEKDTRKMFFNAEMAAGRVPDIVLISKESNRDSMVYTYTKSGIFCDLLSLMKADDTFDFDGLLGYVTKPYQINGKQYVFPLNPSFTTQYGSAEYFTGPMSPDEVFEARENLPDNVYWTSYDRFFKLNTLQGVMNDFINLNDASCSFNDGRFAAILRKLEDVTYEDTAEGLDQYINQLNAVNKGTLRLWERMPYGLYNYAVARHRIGNDIVPVGYPNAEKKLFADNYGGSFFAVTDVSKHKAAAFDFLECILASNANYAKYGFSNYEFFESDIYSQLEEYEDKTIVIDSGSTLIYDDDEVQDMPGKHIKLTQSDAEKYIAYLNSIDAFLPVDSPIYQIYSEECFSDVPRSTEEIAEIIQSRVSILLSESYD